MGNRLTRIYTRTGDHGTTGLGDGRRVEKTAVRIEVLGDIDELNCLIGMIITERSDGAMGELLIDIQHLLFNVGGEISIPGETFINAEYVSVLEQLIDNLNGTLGELNEFILPGGGHASSVCHFARAVCRRAERHLVALAER